MQMPIYTILKCTLFSGICAIIYGFQILANFMFRNVVSNA